MNTTKISNIKDLTLDLTANYEKLNSGEITEKKAREISRMAGKIIYSVKLNLEYNSYMGLKRPILFLDVK